MRNGKVNNTSSNSYPDLVSSSYQFFSKLLPLSEGKFRNNNPPITVLVIANKT